MLVRGLFPGPVRGRRGRVALATTPRATDPTRNPVKPGWPALGLLAGQSHRGVPGTDPILRLAQDPSARVPLNGVLALALRGAGLPVPGVYWMKGALPEGGLTGSPLRGGQALRRSVHTGEHRRKQMCPSPFRSTRPGRQAVDSSPSASGFAGMGPRVRLRGRPARARRLPGTAVHRARRRRLRPIPDDSRPSAGVEGRAAPPGYPFSPWGRGPDRPRLEARSRPGTGRRTTAGPVRPRVPLCPGDGPGRKQEET